MSLAEIVEKLRGYYLVVVIEDGRIVVKSSNGADVATLNNTDELIGFVYGVMVGYNVASEM